MLKNNVIDLMSKLNFPLSSQETLLKCLDILLSTDNFINIVNCYKNEDCDFAKMLDDIKLLAQNLNISHHTAHMLLVLCMAPTLYKKYIQKGIDPQIFYDTMADLRYKLEECRLVHNTCGTFVAGWYKGFFEMRIFALGRLQFEIKNTWFDCEVNGKKIPKDTKVLSVHIPRTGTPLRHELVIKSYKMALEFFKDQFDGEIIFICNSWLLDPWNRTVLNDESNLAQFYDDFTIVETGEYSDYSETWRLFDCLYNGNVDNLPCDTSLRRAYIGRIKSGIPTGYATGVILSKNI